MEEHANYPHNDREALLEGIEAAKEDRCVISGFHDLADCATESPSLKRSRRVALFRLRLRTHMITANLVHAAPCLTVRQLTANVGAILAPPTSLQRSARGKTGLSLPLIWKLRRRLSACNCSNQLTAKPTSSMLVHTLVTSPRKVKNTTRSNVTCLEAVILTLVWRTKRPGLEGWRPNYRSG